MAVSGLSLILRLVIHRIEFYVGFTMIKGAFLIAMRASAIAFAILFGGAAAVAEEICAEVKIEILQEFSIERQAFEARMKITNQLDTFSLENVRIDVDFSDQDGLPVVATSDQSNAEAKFFIRPSELINISDISGGGTVGQSTSAEIKWLIIPALAAADGRAMGKLYYVGARLSYTYGGKEQTITVTPDTIVVKPQPEIELDYFLTRSIVGDNPFTALVEAPVPYTLGVRVRNGGMGFAKKVSIDSAQPRIVQNEQALAVGFKILESYVGNSPAEKTLLLKFGDIEPGTSVVGRWVLETNLSGEFVSFNATSTHAEELGGQLTSLIQDTREHFLERNVLVQLPGRDQIKDFLVRVSSEDSYVYESELTGLSVQEEYQCVDCIKVGNINSGSLSSDARTLVVNSEKLTGFAHVRIEAGDVLKDKMIARVVRGDGFSLSTANAWISQERNVQNPASPRYFLNIFDYHGAPVTTQTYDIYFGGAADVPQAPVIQFISDRTTFEGSQVGFLVKASDLDSARLLLSAESLPSGASFKDQGDNTGVFSWHPIAGQAGNYAVTFKASDGTLSSNLTVSIRVNPQSDIDGDGLDDQWERDKFGNLDQGADGNPDGDELTNLEEFLQDSDPLNASAVLAPTIVSPVYGASIETITPYLVVNNVAHEQGAMVSYQFEVFADQSYLQQVFQGAVPEQVDAEGVTRIQLPTPLSDNHRYYWRTRAIVDGIHSVWEEGRFFTNTSNDSPTPPTIAYPAHNVQVDTLIPRIYLNNARDVDEDAISYALTLSELVEPGSSELLVASVEGIAGGTNGTTSWAPLIKDVLELKEDTRYVVRAKATDIHGSESTTAESRFLASTSNAAPSSPQPLLPVADTVLETTQVTLESSVSSDSEGDVLYYYFELDSIPTFDSAERRTSPAITSDSRRWHVTSLVDNKAYYWRVRAWDGKAYSPWSVSQFSVDIINTAPTVPVHANPGQGAWIESLTPVLAVAPSLDSDGDSVEYIFELYGDESQSASLASYTGQQNQWKVPLLVNHTWYQWRVSARDSRGNQSEWSAFGRFFVNQAGENDAPSFAFLNPVSAMVVASGLVNVQWVDADPDSSATITLMYNGNQVIASDIDEDSDGENDQMFWDVSTLAPGDYQLSAVIEDEESSVVVEACCAITIPEQSELVVLDIPESAQVEESGITELQIGVRLGRPLIEGEQVVVNYSITDASEAIVGNVDNYLLFTSLNWNQLQYISIKGVDDCEVDGDRPVSLVFAALVSNSEQYDGVVPSSVTITNADNETDDQVLFICDYVVVSSQVDSNTNEHVASYRAALRNLGASIEGAVATVSIAGGAQLLDSNGTVTFPAILSGQSVLSEELFAVRRPAGYEEDRAKFTWSVVPGAQYASGGTAENDELVGDDSDNFIDGLGGNDTLYGGPGNDILFGGGGSDQLYGGEGDDAFLIYGNDFGVDYFDGGAGFDQIVGGYFDDVVRMQDFAPANSVEVINLGGGANRIEGTPQSDTLNFSSTQLIGVVLIDGLQGDDFISGSQGPDVIKGGQGSDQLLGNGGDDIFLYEGSSLDEDSINGGSGNDLILGSSQDDIIVMTAFGSSNSIEAIDGAGGQNSIVGTDAANVLDFSSISLTNIHRIDAKDGADTVRGDNGPNVIVGGKGNDILVGNGGDDLFLVSGTEDGVDKVYGGDGFDEIRGGISDDIITLKIHGNDVPFGYATVERIDGGAGFNVVSGDETDNLLDLRGVELIGINEIRDGDGNDTIRGNDGNNIFVSGAGNDLFYGEGGDDTFIADSSSGVDRYIGGDGNDRVVLTSGDDVLTFTYFYNSYVVETIDGGTGVNIIEGTDDIDTLSFTNTQLINIQHIDPKGGNDIVNGSQGDDVFNCSEGNDTFRGREGDDVFRCNPATDGIDRFYGEEGYDVIELTSGDDVFVLAYFYGSATVNKIDGKEGYNIIVATDNALDTLDFSDTELVNISAIMGLAGNDSLTGSPGNDVLIGGAGNDALDGHDGDDTFVVEAGDNGYDKYRGGAGNDRILGTSGDDVIGISYYYSSDRVEVIDGNGGNDVIEGNNSGNSLYFDTTQLIGIAEIRGMGGNDTIKGSAAADTLVGGQGNDTVYGMAGADTFIFSVGDGRDRLYETGSDYDQLIIHGVDKSNIWFFRSGSALFIYFLDSTDRIEIYNWYSSASYKIERVVLDSGDYIEIGGMESLAVEMTPYGNPDVSGFAVPSEAQSTIDTSIASAWQ